MDDKSLSHVRWKCQYQYHIVLFRNTEKVLHGEVKVDVRGIISISCRCQDVGIIEGAACEAHIYLSVAIPPKYNISIFMGLKRQECVNANDI